jgi:predicted small lipoprotein YifL
MRRWLVVIAALSIAIACGLNPQPLPPEDTAGPFADASAAESGAPGPNDASVADTSTTSQDANADANVVDSGNDGGDASLDANDDGG